MSAHSMDLIEFETAVDAPVDAGVPDSPAPGEPTDGGTPAPADGGAEPTPAADAPPTEPTPAIDWTSPEAQQAMEQFVQQREQAQAEAARQAELDQQQQGQFAQIEEGLALLGIDPADFKTWMQQQVAPNLDPLMQAAQQVQQQQAVEQIQGRLTQLGQTHPDLLGDGLSKLAELTDDNGQQMFNPDQVREANQSAVISATVGILEASKGQDGNPTIAWTDAAEHAAKLVAERDATIGKIAVEQFKRQVSGVAGAHQDITGGGTAGAARLTGIEGGDELAVARRFIAERNAR